MFIVISFRSWRDDKLSGIERKSNRTFGLPSKRSVVEEYERYSNVVYRYNYSRYFNYENITSPWHLSD